MDALDLNEINKLQTEKVPATLSPNQLIASLKSYQFTKDTKLKLLDENKVQKIEKALNEKNLAKEVKHLALNNQFGSRERSFLEQYSSKQLNASHIAILADVTAQLIKEGLWKEDDARDIPYEYFTQSQLKKEKYYERFDRNENHDLSYVNFRSKSIDGNNHMFLYSDYPERAEPASNELLGRSPWDIYQKVARMILNSNSLEIEKNYFLMLPSLYFYSKGIFDESLFNILRDELYVGSKFQKLTNKKFDFQEFGNDQKRLFHIFRKYLKQSSFKSHDLKIAVKKYLNLSKNPSTDIDVENYLSTYWRRYNDCWDSLTEKQKNALEKVYMNQKEVSKIEAAKELQISIDSFNDRITGAIQKFNNYFPEMKFIEDKSHQDNFKGDLLFNGFYRKSSALRVHTLYRLDPASGQRIAIEHRGTPPPPIKDHSFYWRTKAMVLDIVKVPDIIDHHYTGDLRPDAYFRRISRDKEPAKEKKPKKSKNTKPSLPKEKQSI